MMNRSSVIGRGDVTIDWDEITSVMIQALPPLGFVDIAGRLESEIAETYQPSKYASLRSQFLGGFWEKCAETLLTIQGLDEVNVSKAMGHILGMWLIERFILNRNFNVSKVLDHQYVQHLLPEDLEDLDGALEDLVINLADINWVFWGYRVDFDSFKNALEIKCRWLQKMEFCLPIVVPTLDHQLLTLVEYGISAQINSCLAHNRNDVDPVICDQSCRKDQLPSKPIQILIRHKAEIRCLKFSHNGLFLASGSVDTTAIVWEVPPAGWELRRKHVLRGRPGFPITCVSWSPDDNSLLACARGDKIRKWNVQTGACMNVISAQVGVLKSCAFWESDGQVEIVFGKSNTLSAPGSIRSLRNGDESEVVSLQSIPSPWNVDFAVTPNGTNLVYLNPLTDRKKLTVKKIGMDEDTSIQEETDILAISISEDSESLILNMSDHEIHVWDLKELNHRPFTYWGHIQDSDRTSSCVGGVESRFLASGTKDSKVCIWNWTHARPIAVLRGGHEEHAVTCVSWNPVRPQMLASAGVDGNICIWGPHSQEAPQNFRHR